MITIGAYIAARGESATLHTRLYGARDAETRWPAITFANSTIDVMVRFASETVRDNSVGRVVDDRGRVYTKTAIANRDQLTYRGIRWEIEDMQFSHAIIGVLGYYHATLIRLEDA